MNEQEKIQIQQRIQALYRYTNAMESGNDTTIAAVLEDATHDATLERMLLELNEVYQIEDRSIVHPDDIAAAHEMLLDTFAGAANQPAETHHRIDEQPIAVRPITVMPAQTPHTRRPSGRKWYQSRAAALVAVALLAVLIVPAVSAFAPQILAWFQPQQFTGISSNSFQSPDQLEKDLTSFLENFGAQTTRNYVGKQLTAITLSQQVAQKEVNFPIQLPGALPASAGHVTQFATTPSDQESFDFNTATTKTYLEQTGQGDATLPANFGSTSITVSLNPGVLISYHNQCTQDSDKVQCSGGTPFSVAEIPDPSLQATGGMSLSDLRSFFLSLPKLPTDIRTLLEHADISNGVVPVPIPTGASYQQVTVQGNRGLLITMSGNGGVIWEAQNIVYIVLAANTNATQLQNSANSLQ